MIATIVMTKMTMTMRSIACWPSKTVYGILSKIPIVSYVGNLSLHLPLHELSKRPKATMLLVNQVVLLKLMTHHMKHIDIADTFRCLDMFALKWLPHHSHQTLQRAKIEIIYSITITMVMFVVKVTLLVHDGDTHHPCSDGDNHQWCGMALTSLCPFCW